MFETWNQYKKKRLNEIFGNWFSGGQNPTARPAPVNNQANTQTNTQTIQNGQNKNPFDPKIIKQCFDNSAWLSQYVQEIEKAFSTGDMRTIPNKIPLMKRASNELYQTLRKMNGK